MRYIILLLLSIIAVEASKITIDERMTDIYFGNGILTTEGEAEIGRYNLFLVPKLQLGNAYNNKQDN